MTLPMLRALARTATALGGGWIATLHGGLLPGVGLAMSAFGAAGLVALLRSSREGQA